MPNDYPLPAHAASIWIAGDTLMLGLPPTGPDGRGHTIAIPLERCGVEESTWGTPLATQRGWHALLAVLRERAREGRATPVGTAAAPVQYDIDAVLRGLATPRNAKFDSRGKVRATTLADLGLD